MEPGNEIAPPRRDYAGHDSVFCDELATVGWVTPSLTQHRKDLVGYGILQSPKHQTPIARLTHPTKTHYSLLKKMLNRLIQPSQHFHITIREMAKLLGIPPQIIVRIELWAHVIFVHRKDRGGQFVSYRKLERWKYAVACQIQKCISHKQLDKLWNLIEADRKKFSKQYRVAAYKAFIKRVWNQQWEKLSEVRNQKSEVRS